MNHFELLQTFLALYNYKVNVQNTVPGMKQPCNRVIYHCHVFIPLAMPLLQLCHFCHIIHDANHIPTGKPNIHLRYVSIIYTREVIFVNDHIDKSEQFHNSKPYLKVHNFFNLLHYCLR